MTYDLVQIDFRYYINTVKKERANTPHLLWIENQELFYFWPRHLSKLLLLNLITERATNQDILLYLSPLVKVEQSKAIFLSLRGEGLFVQMGVKMEFIAGGFPPG